MRPKAINQPNTCTRQKAMPNIARSGGQPVARRFLLARFVEKAEIQSVSVGRKNRKINATGVSLRTHWPSLARLQPGRLGHGNRHAVHSSITVARGGRSSKMECTRPWQAIGCAVAVPKGVPMLEPP